jgi:hypothetical protein
VRNGRVVVVRSSKGLWRSPLVAALWALALGSLLAGCTLVDTVDKRADWMNESVTRFRNQNILRNIVRSARDEPLSFAALSSVQGHNTSQNTFPTFPPIDWAAGIVKGTTGAGSSQYNVSSDFTLNPVDDSGTYAALIAPLDASTIALFTQRSGYQTNFLYLLFFDKIRIADADGRVLAQFYSNSVAFDTSEMCLGDRKNGFCGPRNMLAYTLLAYLDLRFNIEKGALTGQSRRPRTQICFERGSPAPGRWTDLQLRPTGGKIALPAKGAKATASYCDEDGTWFAGTPGDTATKGKGPGTGANYVIYDARNKVWIELSTRSTWGIYQFLGTLADNLVHKNGRHVRLVQPGYIDNRDELIVLDIAKGRASGDCFVDAEMDDRTTYCVPNGPSSRMTRAAFVVLHQLTALQRQFLGSSVSDRTLSTRQVQ